MFVAKATLIASLFLMAVGQQSCPNNQWTYDAVSKKCYLVSKSVLPQASAAYTCTAQGATLAIVHDASVQNAIQGLAQSSDSDFYYWIGLVVNNNGQFQWSDGSILDYFRWCPNNPTTSTSNTCGVLDPKSNCWRNANCNNYLPYICIYDPSVTTTTIQPTTTTTGDVPCRPDNYPQGSGSVYSPGYPGNYGNNEDCNYLLTANTNGVVTLRIVSLNTEQCCDFLYIYDGPTRFSPLITRLSGVISNQYYTSTSQFMTLRFVTDGSRVGPGFSGSYSTSYPTTTTRVMTTTTTPRIG